jgi:hypothetical protein
MDILRLKKADNISSPDAQQSRGNYASFGEAFFALPVVLRPLQQLNPWPSHAHH